MQKFLDLFLVQRLRLALPRGLLVRALHLMRLAHRAGSEFLLVDLSHFVFSCKSGGGRPLLRSSGVLGVPSQARASALEPPTKW